jgi:outer membrane receptor for ferric coprogen and ferric-rhodotorulic acid
VIHRPDEQVPLVQPLPVRPEQRQRRQPAVDAARRHHHRAGLDEENVSLTTPTTAGSRLNLTALETPASVESLSGEQVRARGDRSVQDAVSRSTGISRTGTPGDGGTSLQARGLPGRVR